MMITEKVSKTSKSRRIHSSRRRPERLRLSCQYSVSTSEGIVLSLTFSSRNRRDLARERYLDALSGQARSLASCWVNRFPARTA